MLDKKTLEQITAFARQKRDRGEKTNSAASQRAEWQTVMSKRTVAEKKKEWVAGLRRCLGITGPDGGYTEQLVNMTFEHLSSQGLMTPTPGKKKISRQLNPKK